MLNKFHAFLQNEDGATAIEYGLLAAGISLAIAVAVYAFGGELVALFEGMSGQLNGEG